MSDGPPAQFRRVAETGRRELQFTIDARTVTGLEGDTLLTALLMNGRSLRSSVFGGHGFQLGPAAGLVLAERIADGRTTTPIDGLSIVRFRMQHRVA